MESRQMHSGHSDHRIEKSIFTAVYVLCFVHPRSYVAQAGLQLHVELVMSIFQIHMPSFSQC